MLPAWIRVIAATASAKAFADQVLSIVIARGGSLWPKVVATARKAAGPDQLLALDTLTAGDRRKKPADQRQNQ